MRSRLLRALALVVIGALPAGCKPSEPVRLNLSFSTYASTPVVLTRYRLNGHALLTPTVPGLVAGVADVEPSRADGGLYSLAYPSGDDPAVLAMELEWVELLGGRAWRAEAQVPVGALTGEPGDSVRVMPIFGPDGLVIIASDPVPTSAAIEQVDVLRLCGARAPEADRTDPAAFEDLIGVSEWKAWWHSADAIRSTSSGSECTSGLEVSNAGFGNQVDPGSTE